MLHRKSRFSPASAPLALVAVGASACSAQGGEGDAELTIVGDPTLALAPSGSVELVVGYHGEDGAPLAGEVAFAIEGEDAEEAALREDAVETDEIGAAAVVLEAGDRDEIDFEVRAEAPGADPAVWEIRVDSQAPVDPNGVYELRSEIDLTAGLPGILGDAVGLVVDLTDDSADPTLWIVEKLIDAAGIDIDPPYTLIRTVNSLLLDFVAPAVVNTLVDLGEDFGAMTTQFGVITELEVTGEPGQRTATHELVGFVVHHGGEAYEFSMEEAGLSRETAREIEVAYDADGRHLELDSHELPVSYGTLALVILEQVLLSGMGGDLEDFLLDGIDCDLLAEEIADRLDRGSNTESAIATACPVVISQGVERILDKLTEVDDAGVLLELEGEAAVVDENGDRVGDRLEEGSWSGALRVVDVDESSPLSPDDSTFSGERASE